MDSLLLLHWLTAAGAVVIEGPKACGKTRTTQQVAASEVLLDSDPSARQALAVPGLWNLVIRDLRVLGGAGRHQKGSS